MLYVKVTRMFICCNTAGWSHVRWTNHLHANYLSYNLRCAFIFAIKFTVAPSSVVVLFVIQVHSFSIKSLIIHRFGFSIFEVHASSSQCFSFLKLLKWVKMEWVLIVMCAIWGGLAMPHHESGHLYGEIGYEKLHPTGSSPLRDVIP